MSLRRHLDTAPGRIGGLVAVLAVVFVGALGVGATVGPVDARPEPAMTHGESGAEHDMATMGSAQPAGLQVSQDGYRLELDRTVLRPGSATRVGFRITHEGHPATDFAVEHTKRLHLIAVRRDFTGFQHVHPTMAADGRWSTDVALTPGQWRIFADFRPAGGDPLTLGADVGVAGGFSPAATPHEDVRIAHVDGYTVTLTGDLMPGKEAPLDLSISRAGHPVTDLDPYLGAYGHLVTLREGDLAYLHVHPDGEPGDGTTRPGPTVRFHTTPPSAGRYHLYLDFQHHGVVHTAAFTVTAGEHSGGEHE